MQGGETPAFAGFGESDPGVGPPFLDGGCGPEGASLVPNNEHSVRYRGLTGRNPLP